MPVSKSKKAQSALEYLMTYGWGLVVVGIIIAALTLIYTSSQNGDGTTTTFIGNLTITNTNLPNQTADALVLAVSNTSGRRLTNLQVEVKTADNTIIPGTLSVASGENPIVLQPGEQDDFSFIPSDAQGWLAYGNELDLSVTIKGLDSDQFTKQATGQIRFSVQGTPSASLTCPDNVCSAGENCPADAASCSEPPVCQQNTCTNGCGTAYFALGQQDTQGANLCNNSTGCTTPPCRCDGFGFCENIPSTSCDVILSSETIVEDNGFTNVSVNFYNFSGTPTLNNFNCGSDGQENGTVSCPAGPDGQCTALQCSNYSTPGNYPVSITLNNGATPTVCTPRTVTVTAAGAGSATCAFQPINPNPTTVGNPVNVTINVQNVNQNPSGGQLDCGVGSPIAFSCATAFGTTQCTATCPAYSTDGAYTLSANITSVNPPQAVLCSTPLQVNPAPAGAACNFSYANQTIEAGAGASFSFTSFGYNNFNGVPTVNAAASDCGDGATPTINCTGSPNGSCTATCSGYIQVGSYVPSITLNNPGNPTVLCTNNTPANDIEVIAEPQIELSECGPPISGWENNKTYTLSQAITNTTFGTCFDISGNNITLNCGGASKTITNPNDSGSGLIVVTGTDNTVTNCFIDNSGAFTTGIIDAGTNTEISGNTINNLSQVGANGIQASGSFGLIANNTILGTNGGHSIWVGPIAQAGNHTNSCPVGTCREDGTGTAMVCSAKGTNSNCQ